MRVLYRITPAKFAKDLTGVGARIAGGRWNHKGTSVIYTATSRSLATVEALVHLSQPEFLVDRKIVSIEIPKTIVPQVVDSNDLPKNWRKYPAPHKLADVGTRWVVSMKSLLLQVPSAVIKDEFNMLINPAHPDMKFAKISKIEVFTLDKRFEPVIKGKK